MRHQTSWFPVFFCITVFEYFGCGGETPATEMPVEQVVVSTEEAGIQRGHEVFDRVCGTCHPGGQSDVGPKIIDTQFSVDRMTRQIRNGSDRMRPISESRLPHAYLGDLIGYLHTIGAVKLEPNP